MFKVNIKKITNFSVDEAQKLERAKDLWARVWNSQEFKERVENFHYDEAITIRTGLFSKKKIYNRVFNFRYRMNLTNKQIYNALMNGAEVLSSEVDREADLKVTLYVANTSTIGYTYDNTDNIWSNRRFFRTFTPAQIAGNLAHEYCHKLGFDHEGRFNPLREYTVPYAIGYLTEELAEKYDKYPSTWVLAHD